jgi:hypothetical protein
MEMFIITRVHAKKKKKQKTKDIISGSTFFLQDRSMPQLNLLLLFNACPIENHVVGSSSEYPLFETMHELLL